jgi:hypothetical protein
MGCSSGLAGTWSGDCEFEDLVGTDGRFMELIYRLELELEPDGFGSLSGQGQLSYTVDEISHGSGLALSGSSQDGQISLTLVFDEELSDLLLEGVQDSRDVLEGDCAAGVAEGDFLLIR